MVKTIQIKKKKEHVHVPRHDHTVFISEDVSEKYRKLSIEANYNDEELFLSDILELVVDLVGVYDNEEIRVPAISDSFSCPYLQGKWDKLGFIRLTCSLKNGKQCLFSKDREENLEHCHRYKARMEELSPNCKGDCTCSEK